MNEREAPFWTPGPWERSTTKRGGDVLQVGSRVRVTSYCPFRGMRGTIRTVDIIPADLEELYCFYLVTLDTAHIQESIWFEYDEVELIAHPLTAHHRDR